MSSPVETSLINLEKFEVDERRYRRDTDYAEVVDSVLAGGLRALAETLEAAGYAELAETVGGQQVDPGHAPRSLEGVQASLLPAIRSRLATDGKAAEVAGEAAAEEQAVQAATASEEAAMDPVPRATDADPPAGTGGDVESPDRAVSRSVTGVVRQLRRRGSVSSWKLARRLFRRHPEYGAGLAGKLARGTGPATSARRPISDWIAAAQQLLAPEVQMLDGRLMVLALARADAPLGDFLEGTGLLEAIEGELESPVDSLLRPQQPSGLDRYGPIDRAPLHPDHPSADDQLGRLGFARALALRLGRIWNEYARSEARSSFILHLHGPWGSGKTSLLTMLRCALQPVREERTEPRPESPASWIVVDFNAWRHQRLEAPWWQLLDAVYRQASRQLGTIYGNRCRAFRLRLSETRWRVLTIRRDLVFSVAAAVFLAALIYWVLRPSGLLGPLATASAEAKRVGDVLALLGTLISGGVVAGRSLLSGSASSAQAVVEASADPMARITEHFGELIGWIGRPVAILVDDLDRCQETYVIRLLEGIQTLFNDPRVVYVIAADRRWLHACYEHSYARFADSVREPGRRLGTLFLEKVFQLSVAVPRLSAEMRQAYWRFLIRGRREDVEDELERAREDAERELSAAGSEAEVLAAMPASEEDPIRAQAWRQAAVERMAASRVEEATLYFLEQFSHLLEPNPRAMKRLLNAYAVHRDLALLSGLNVLVDVERRKQLALWTILSLRWPLLRDDLLARIDGEREVPDEAVRSLGSSEEVRRVIAGEGVGAALDLEAIRLLVGLGGSEAGSAGAVA